MELFNGPLSPSTSDLNEIVNAINAISTGSSVTTLAELTDVLVDDVDDIFISGARPANIDEDNAANNTAFGSQSLITITTGNNNTSIGGSALNLLTTGNNNVAVGVDSLSIVTTGDDNISVGNEAGVTLTTGNNNILIGTGADVDGPAAVNQIVIGNNIFGYADNTATIGDSSITDVYFGDTTTTKLHAGNLFDTFIEAGYTSGYLGSVPSLVGHPAGNFTAGLGAGGSLTTGSLNTFLGSNAANAATTAIKNISIGLNSGGTMETGTQMVAIGYNADVSSATAINQISIGANALCTGNNQVQIGGTIASGNAAEITDVTFGNATAKLHADGSSLTGMGAVTNTVTTPTVIDGTKYLVLSIGGTSYNVALATPGT